MTLLPISERLEVVKLFPPELAYSFMRAEILALNCLYIEYGDNWPLETYVLDAVDCFPIKVSLNPYYSPLCVVEQMSFSF